MGRIVLERVIREGYRVTATDITSGAREYAVSLGAEFVSSPREVAEHADWIILSLPGPEAVIEVVTGDRGLVGALEKRHVVIDTSTVAPGTARQVSEWCDARQAGFIDAPILGRPATVGNWMLPVGGDADLVERARPLLLTFAGNVIRVGDVGAGHTVKLLNQLMFSTINGITAEVFAIGEKLGIPASKFFEAISTSGAATVSGLFRECGDKIVADDYKPVFSVDLLCKDARLAVEMARDGGAPPFIASGVHDYNLLAQAQGMGELDTSALFRLFNGFYGAHGDSSSARADEGR